MRELHFIIHDKCKIQQVNYCFNRTEISRDTPVLQNILVVLYAFYCKYNIFTVQHNKA